jgi:hypothetical protein
MGTTHAAVGLLVGAPLLWLAPEYAALALSSGLAGGLFPDLDMLGGVHRRTLHLTEYYLVGAVVALVAAALVATPVTVAAAVFLLAAAAHCVGDWLGGSSERRPWEAVTDRGVYLHVSDRWLAPRRWVRYDGAPEDLALTVVLGGLGAWMYGPPAYELVAAGVAVAVVYAVARKRIPQLSGRFPAALRVASALFLRSFRR